MPATLSKLRPYTPPTEGIFTAEDLATHPEWGPCELVRGKVVPVCRPKSKHGRLVVELASELNVFVKKRKLGMVFSDSGVFLEHDPDTVRGPDIYFVRAERCPVGAEFDSYMELAPDLCVEIILPSDRAADMQDKIEQYLHFGIKLVWVIDPKIPQAKIYRLDGTTEIIALSGALNGEDVLPGFELSMGDLFAALRP